MKNTDIVGLAIRETPLTWELLELKETGLIEDYEVADAIYNWSDRVPPVEYKWQAPETGEQRFAYEWRRQFIEEDYIYFAMITREEIRTAEEYEATREKLSGTMYLF